MKLKVESISEFTGGNIVEDSLFDSKTGLIEPFDGPGLHPDSNLGQLIREYILIDGVEFELDPERNFRVRDLYGARCAAIAIANLSEQPALKGREELQDAVQTLVAVIDEIVRVWEHGDLAGAVRNAKEQADAYRE